MPNKNKELTPKQGVLTDDKEYQGLLKELQSIISKGQYTAYKAVDNIKVQTYWQLGERIVREEFAHKERADYGEYLIDNLTKDLNIGKRLLYEIIMFHRLYPIVHTVSAQLSWSHYGALLGIAKDDQRAFYQNQAILHSWSVRDLTAQIKANLFEKSSKKAIEETFRTTLPAIIDPQTVFKGAYDFDFIELKPSPKEKDLEDNILSKIELFLKELGADFSFAGRQVPIKMDRTTHYIDLVLYHRAIPCNVLVDLKMGKIDAGDIGQMNKYIGYYRKNKQYDHEKDTIGLIICQDIGHEEVMYALNKLEEQIFIAQYKTKLPSEEKIMKALSEL